MSKSKQILEFLSGKSPRSVGDVSRKFNISLDTAKKYLRDPEIRDDVIKIISKTRVTRYWKKNAVHNTDHKKGTTAPSIEVKVDPNFVHQVQEIITDRPRTVKVLAEQLKMTPKSVEAAINSIPTGHLHKLVSDNSTVHYVIFSNVPSKNVEFKNALFARSDRSNIWNQLSDREVRARRWTNA